VVAATVWLLWGLPRFGVAAAAWSYVVRSGLDFVLLVPALAQFRLPEWRSDVVRETGKRLRPIIMGSAYYRSDLWVDRFLSSMAPPGNLSLLSLARQVHHAAARVLSRALAAPVVPQLAERAHVGDWPSFEQTYKKRLWWILLTISAGLGVFTIFGRQLLELAFRGRNFPQGDVQLLWWLMVLLAGVLIADPLIQVSWNAFYAMGHASTPNRIGGIAYTLGILFRFVGFYVAGIKGIAVGTTCYYCLNLLLLQLALERTQRASRALMRADPVI
jgi:putative peptidoglycan lipid II flippase